MTEINRRDLLAQLAALPAVVSLDPLVVPVPVEPPPALAKFSCWMYGDNGTCVKSETEPLSMKQAQQFLDDAIRDMTTVMAQGKRLPTREEPLWLTTQVDTLSGR